MQVLKPEIRSGIIAAAASLFSRNGYTGTTMRDVADRLSMSASNLYKYFRDKDDLFDAVAGPYARSFRTHFAETLSHADDDEFSDARLRHVVEGFTGAISGNPDVFYILMKLSAGSRFENFRSECEDLLTCHILADVRYSEAVCAMTPVIVSNLFEGFARIARECKTEQSIFESLDLLFRYHMAGYRKITE